jgi:hypothetical protein
MCSISGWLDMSCRASTYRTRKWNEKKKRVRWGVGEIASVYGPCVHTVKMPEA